MAPILKFFDLRNKESFSTDKFSIKTENGRRRAIAVSPKGVKASRFLKKE